MRVIGTAGHVDHGKSTLIAALTGAACTPAEAAGLKPGDAIIAIDDVDMTGFTPEVDALLQANIEHGYARFTGLVGKVVSRARVTRKLQVSRSPQRLVAVQVTGVVPTLKVVPLPGLHAVVAPAQLSVAAGIA